MSQPEQKSIVPDQPTVEQEPTSDVQLDSMFAPGMWENMLSEVEVIAEACPIDVYSAGINKRWGWPWRLMSYYEARPGVTESADSVMIDSSVRHFGQMIGRDSSSDKYTKNGVVDQARKLGAEFIIPPEFTHEHDVYDEMDGLGHTEEVKHQLDEVHSPRASDMGIHDWDDVDANVLLPIHPPYEEYINELRHWDPGEILNFTDDPHFDYPQTEEEMRWYKAGRAHFTETLDLISKFDGVAIGGLLNLDLEERIDAIETVARMVPSNKHIHVLAPGNELEMIKVLREHSHQIDSLDISTPENSARNGKIPDRTGYQHKHLFPAGTNSSTLRGISSLLSALQIAYQLSDMVNWEKVWSEYQEDKNS